MSGNDDPKWWNHPDMVCRDKPEYADLSLVRGNRKRLRKDVIEDMRLACFRCPVLKECSIDFLSHAKDYEHYGIRAGVRGRTS